MVSKVLAIAVVLLAGLPSRQASACSGATQSVRLLLGESEVGLVWARLRMRRSSNFELKRLPWDVTGDVEIAPWGGASTRQLKEVGSLHWTLLETGRPDVAQPLSSHLEALVKKINLPGFQRPKSVEVFDCSGATACGIWRLEYTPGTLTIVDSASSTRLPVPFSYEFVRDAELVGAAGSVEELRQHLVIVGVARYRLRKGIVNVLNLATGDHHVSYDRDEPLSRATPKRVKARRCGEVACPALHWTMHHGSHLDFPVIFPSKR